MTTFTINFPVTLGIGIRSFIIFVLFYILVKKSFLNGFKTLVLTLIPYIFLLFSFVVQTVTKEPFFVLEELQFYMKVFFYITIFLFIYKVIDFKKIKMNFFLNALQISTFIVSVSFWIAIFTKTSLNSYSYEKEGFSGWFFAANELSVITLILVTFSSLTFLHKNTFISFINFVLILSITPMIGTKTAFFGAIILLFILTLGLFAFKNSLGNSCMFLFTFLIFILISPYTPAMHNTLIYTNNPKPLIEKTEKIDAHNEFLSSRDIYYKKIKEDYKESSMLKKFIGLGYAGNYFSSPKMIEMDFYDMFFSFGILGFAILLSPLLLYTINILQFNYITFDYLLLFISYALCLGIAFYVGHVLFAPSVMSYVGLLLISLKYKKTGSR